MSSLHFAEADSLLTNRVTGCGEANCGYSPSTPSNTVGYPPKVSNSDTIFTFGHINRPFSRYIPFQHYSAWLDAYNTGGWMVGTVKPIRTQGRSVVFVDDKLNSAAIRVYNEQNPSGDVAPPFVEEAAREFRRGNPLVKAFNKWFKPQAAPWSNLTDHIGKAVRISRTHLEGNILNGV